MAKEHNLKQARLMLETASHEVRELDRAFEYLMLLSRRGDFFSREEWSEVTKRWLTLRERVIYGPAPESAEPNP